MRNWVIRYYLAALLAVILCASAYARAQDWKQLSGDHFICYFTADESFAKNVLDRAEVDYKRIASELGYSRYSDFWLWDKRVKIYIHPDKKSFLGATGQPAWSEGMADYIHKEVISYVWSKDFIESLLPHEIAHLIFRDFVGFKGEVPLWLDEGVAQWAEEAKRAEIKKKAEGLYQEDGLLLLPDLMKLKMERMKDLERVYIKPTVTKEGERGVVFLSTENLIAVYYLEAVSLVGFLIEKYGSLRFADFCRELRDGKALEDALRLAYAGHIGSLGELESAWRRYLANGCK